MKQGLLKRVAPAVLAAMSVGLSGCNFDISVGGDGVPLDELDMSGDAPDTLQLATSSRVIITEGDALNITVDGDQDAVDALRFDLDGSDLGIYSEDNWSGNGKATVRVTMPAPRELDVAGSGSIEAATLSDTAEINIAGAGSVAVAEVSSNALDVSIAGSGDVTATGSVEQLEISIGGSGDVEFAGLTAERVEISIAGSGDVTLTSDGEVNASIAGSGDVSVTGNAKCSVSAAGSGTLSCAPRAAEAADTANEETAPDDAAES